MGTTKVSTGSAVAFTEEAATLFSGDNLSGRVSEMIERMGVTLGSPKQDQQDLAEIMLDNRKEVEGLVHGDDPTIVNAAFAMAERVVAAAVTMRRDGHPRPTVTEPQTDEFARFAATVVLANDLVLRNLRAHGERWRVRLEDTRAVPYWNIRSKAIPREEVFGAEAWFEFTSY